MPSQSFAPELSYGAPLIVPVCPLPANHMARGVLRTRLAARPAPVSLAAGDLYRRVLIIEDSVLQASELREAFLEAGFDEVVCASTPSAARCKLEAAHPDVAVVDIDLGDGPSFEMADALAQHGVPFLFATGYDRGALPWKWRGVPCLFKPVAGEQVVAAALRMLDQDKAAPADGVQ